MVKKTVVKRGQFEKPSQQKRMRLLVRNRKKSVSGTPAVETLANDAVENTTEPTPRKRERKPKRQEPLEIIEQIQEDNVQQQEEIGESGQNPEQGQ